MIHHLESGVKALGQPDVAVIGSGPVGIMVAVALARRGKKVVLCECGDVAPDARAQALNDSDVVGRAHQGVSEGRARLLGGTSTLWGGQLVPFREIDFLARPWLGLDDWPIRRGDLAAYYEAAARMLGLPLADDDERAIWSRLGHAQPDFGEGLEVILTRWLKQPNAARYFAQELKDLARLDVVLDACAVGFEAQGARITGVRLRSMGGVEQVLRADQVVLACGTIEASRLMLHAAHQAPDLPWARNDWVGRGFQDHLDMRAAGVKPLDRGRFDDIFDNIVLKGFKYNPKLLLSPEVQEAHGITNIAAVMTYESSITEHLSNIKIFVKALRNGAVPPDLASLPRHLKALGKIWWPLILRYIRDNRLFNPGDLGIGLRVHCEQVPLGESRITIDPARVDGHGLSRCVLDWRVDGREIESIAVFCEAVKARMEALGLAEIEIDPLVVARDPAALAQAQDTNHHCGGLRMAARMEDGVVDADMRVFGTRNLYVAGAAVFPSSSFANPTFTAMALGLRLVDHLAGEKA